jgi:hypothetical protein
MPCLLPRPVTRGRPPLAPVRGLVMAAVMVIMAVAQDLRAVSATAADDAAPAAAAADEIAAWIEQLSAEQFAQREAATRSLAGAGRGAIEPLTQAIGRGDLEVGSRAVEILREMLGGDDVELAADAERTLESLAEGMDPAIASLAEATLDFHTMGLADAARQKLEALGAVVSEEFMPSGQRGLAVLFNTGWTGKPEDLRLLARLRGVARLGLHGVRLDEASVAVLGRLRGMERLELYGTGVDDAALAVLAEKLPGAKIDVRKGGKLGVGGQAIGACVINHVQEGSAAARGGVQAGDVILRIDGEPVASFETLTERVGRRGPGEKIELEIERVQPGGEPQRFKKTVELGGWE